MYLFRIIMIVFSVILMGSTKVRSSSKQMIVYMPGVPSELYPPNVLTQKNFMIVQCVFQNLVRVNENTEIIGDLAKKWTISEGGTKYTFFIKDTIFHDGTPVTTKDIVNSISSHFWSDSKSIIANFMRNVAYKGSEPIKDGEIAPFISFTNDTVSFKLIKPYPPFLHILSIPGYAIFKTSQKDWSNPVGSGPMRGSFDKKSRVWRLEKSESYTSSHFQLKKLDIEEKPLYKTALAALAKEDADFAVGYSLSEVASEKLPNDFAVKETNTLAFHHMFFNLDNPYFKNKQNRELISRYIKSRLGVTSPAYQVPISTFIPVGVLANEYYQRVIKPVTLAEVKAGLKRVPKKPLKLVCRWEYVDDNLLKMMTEAFNELGIKIEIDVVKIAGFVKYLKNANYDILLGNYFGTVPDPDGFLEQLNPQNPIQYGQLPSEGFFKAINAIRFSSSKRKRLELYADELRKLEDEWYFLPLYRVNLPIVHNRKLKIPNSSFRYEAELWKILWEGK